MNLEIVIQAANTDTGDPRMVYRPITKDFLIDGESFDPKSVKAIREMTGDGHAYRFTNVGTDDQPLHGVERID
jgi:hypothetical protein